MSSQTIATIKPDRVLLSDSSFRLLLVAFSEADAVLDAIDDIRVSDVPIAEKEQRIARLEEVWNQRVEMIEEEVAWIVARELARRAAHPAGREAEAPAEIRAESAATRTRQERVKSPAGSRRGRPHVEVAGPGRPSDSSGGPGWQPLPNTGLHEAQNENTGSPRPVPGDCSGSH